MSIEIIIYLLIGTVLYSFGDWFSKKYSMAPGFLLGLAALVSYALTTFCWLPALTKHHSLSILGTIWAVMTTLTAVLIGVLIFKESLTTLQIMGIVLAIISIVLLSI